jgi:hypothetical protein
MASSASSASSATVVEPIAGGRRRGLASSASGPAGVWSRRRGRRLVVEEARPVSGRGVATGVWSRRSRLWSSCWRPASGPAAGGRRLVQLLAADASRRGGQHREAEAEVRRRRRYPVRERVGEEEAERERERAISGGGSEGRGVRPLQERGAGAGARGRFRSSPVLPRCEARIELLYRAGLRGLFRLSWAVPIWKSRPTKHLDFQKSRSGRESVS